MSCSTEVATHRPSCPSTTAPTLSSSAASTSSGSSWAKGKTTSTPSASSPAPAVLPSPWQHHPAVAGPARNRPPPPRCPNVSASTLRPCHRQRQLTLEPFFLASLPGFLASPGGKHLQAATRIATAGRPPGIWTTLFLRH
jgi:hypothetical protein